MSERKLDQSRLLRKIGLGAAVPRYIPLHDLRQLTVGHENCTVENVRWQLVRRRMALDTPIRLYLRGTSGKGSAGRDTRLIRSIENLVEVLRDETIDHSQWLAQAAAAGAYEVSINVAAYQGRLLDTFAFGYRHSAKTYVRGPKSTDGNKNVGYNFGMFRFDFDRETLLFTRADQQFVEQMVERLHYTGIACIQFKPAPPVFLEVNPRECSSLLDYPLVHARFWRKVVDAALADRK